jgi:hypothetical protein
VVLLEDAHFWNLGVSIILCSANDEKLESVLCVQALGKMRNVMGINCFVIFQIVVVLLFPVRTPNVCFQSGLALTVLNK